MQCLEHESNARRWQVVRMKAEGKHAFQKRAYRISSTLLMQISEYCDMHYASSSTSGTQGKSHCLSRTAQYTQWSCKIRNECVCFTFSWGKHKVCNTSANVNRKPSATNTPKCTKRQAKTTQKQRGARNVWKTHKWHIITSSCPYVTFTAHQSGTVARTSANSFAARSSEANCSLITH